MLCPAPAPVSLTNTHTHTHVCVCVFAAGNRTPHAEQPKGTSRARKASETLRRQRRSRAPLLGDAHSVEVRCYILICRCLARDARCNTTSHLTADAGFSYMYRAKHLNTMSHLTAAGSSSVDDRSAPGCRRSGVRVPRWAGHG